MSDGPNLSGQEYDRKTNRVYPFTQQQLDYSGQEDQTRTSGAEGDDATDLTPTDRAAQLRREYDLAAIVTALEAEVIAVPGYTVIDSLPDVLNSITVTYNKTVGNGSTTHPVSQQAFVIVESGSGSLNPRATAEGSAAIIPAVSWDISSHYKRMKVPCTFYTFNIAATTVTMANVLARLTTIAGAPVLALPLFKPKEHQLKIFGAQVAVQANADSQASLGMSDSVTRTKSLEWGNGSSTQVGASVRIETIPATIHGTITITLDTSTQAATATATAYTVALLNGFTIEVPAITTNTITASATASGSVTPNSLTATSPDSIPVTGLYLTDLASQQDDFGVYQFRATVVNFTVYA